MSHATTPFEADDATSSADSSTPNPAAGSFWASLRASRYWPRGRDHARLTAELTAYRLQRQVLGELDDAKTRNRARERDHVEKLLTAAEEALAVNDVRRGWVCFHAGRQADLFFDVTDHSDRLGDWGTLLRAETTKLDSPWRQAAATTLLDPETSKPPGVWALYHVRRLLDEHYDNMWRQLRTFRRYLAALASFSILFVVGVVLVDALGGPLIPGVETVLLVGVALFGGLGATVSAALSAGRDSTRNPERLVDTWVGLARITVGMAAALALFVFLHSGIVSFGPLSAALALAIAFVAGFSDRLLVRTVGTVVEPDGRPDAS